MFAPEHQPKAEFSQGDIKIRQDAEGDHLKKEEYTMPPNTYSRKPRVSPPNKFTGDGRKLRKFEIAFRRYAKYEEQTGIKEIELLPFNLEGEAAVWFDEMDESEKTDINRIFTAMKARFCPESFLQIAHEQLVATKQQAQEPISEYILKFSDLTQSLDLTEQQKITQFRSNVLGHIREDLMMFAPRTLTSAFERARVKEAAQKLNENSVEEKLEKLLKIQENQLKEKAAKSLQDAEMIKAEVIKQIKIEAPEHIHQISDASNDAIEMQKIQSYPLSNQVQAMEACRPYESNIHDETIHLLAEEIQYLREENDCLSKNMEEDFNMKSIQCRNCSRFGHGSQDCWSYALS